MSRRRRIADGVASQSEIADGVAAHNRSWSATRIRRVVQIVFLLLFFALVLLARPHAGADPSPLLNAFFLIDPLILIVTWLAAHSVPLVLLWSLIVIAVTVILGRVFC